jgi:hypothetical protein
VDESATGSVNFSGTVPYRTVPFFLLGRGRIAPMHLRMPSIDQGVQAFVWTLVFFLYMWLGSVAVGFPTGTSFIVSLVIAGGIFLLVRTRGGDYPGPR